MPNLETKKSSIDKKQETYESTGRDLGELKKEITGKMLTPQQKKKWDKFTGRELINKKIFPEQDVEEFATSAYSGIEDAINIAKDFGLTPEEEMAIKGKVASLMVELKRYPGQYLEKVEGEENENGKYKLKKSAITNRFNNMDPKDREIFVKYELF